MMVRLRLHDEENKMDGASATPRRVSLLCRMLIGMAMMASTELGYAALPVRADNTPGFVKVEWSLETGEKWEVKGLADRETGRPMATNTIFAICSNTKPVTSVLALTFVEEGKLDLDDPVSKYFPEFAHIKFNSKYKGVKKEGNRPGHPILLRHLITHLSGLWYSVRDGAHKPDAVSLVDQVKFAVEKGVSREPGEMYVYNGLGFSVMGAIIEKIAGRKIDVLMQERVFDPLGMNDTTFYPSSEQMARAATVYHYPKDGGTPKRIGFRRYSEPLDNRERTPILSGGLFSTAVDYLKFEQMLALKGVGLNGRRILKEETFEKYLATRQTPPGDKVDASFDIHFNKQHTGGGKGGLYGTHASADWAKKSCRVSFKAVSAKIPKEMSFNAK